MSITELFVADKDTDTHRVCGCCGKLKPVEEFYKDGKYRDGRTRYRRDCISCYKMTRFKEGERK